MVSCTRSLQWTCAYWICLMKSRSPPSQLVIARFCSTHCQGKWMWFTCHIHVHSMSTPTACLVIWESVQCNCSDTLRDQSQFCEYWNLVMGKRGFLGWKSPQFYWIIIKEKMFYHLFNDNLDSLTHCLLLNVQ